MPFFPAGLKATLILLGLHVPRSMQELMCHTCHWRTQNIGSYQQEGREKYEDYHVSQCLNSTSDEIPAVPCSAGRCFTWKAIYTVKDGRKFYAVARNCGMPSYPTSGCSDKSPGKLAYLDLDGDFGGGNKDVATVKDLKVCFCNTDKCNSFVPDGPLSSGEGGSGSEGGESVDNPSNGQVKVRPLPLVLLAAAAVTRISWNFNHYSL